MTRESSSSASAVLSGVLAAVIANPIGTTPPSVRTWRLVPDFARSVGLGPVFFPAQRGFVERGVGRLPGPLQPLRRVIVLEEQTPHRLPDTAVDPALKAAMDRGAGAELAGHGLPLTPRPQHVEHAVEHPSGRNPRPTDRKSTRLNSSHDQISYAVFCL